jgi:hypothetical protein
MSSDQELFSLSKRRFTKTEKDVKLSIERFSQAFPIEKRNSTTYAKWSNKSVSLDTITRMFGSFEKACYKFSIEISGKKDRYTDDELLSFFEELWRWRKQVPSVLDFKKYGNESGKYLSSETIRRRFGDYKKFCKNFSDYKLNLITKKELLEISSPDKLRKPISDSIRHKLIYAAKSRCSLCGKSAKIDKSIHLEIDHVTPFSKGGTNQIENLRVLCNLCNRGRSNKFLD